MTTKKSTSTTAPRAVYATKEPTELIMQFCDWIEREVGVKLHADARRAVYLGSALRADFQKSKAAARTQSAPAKAVTSRRRPLPTPKVEAKA